tara:strand:- start:7574 stop:8974 length:1401 start_codon:yes stop_codon:yes gene_type:complete
LKQIIFFIPFLISILFSADVGHHGVNGQELPLYSIIPFVGILLSIAIIPLVANEFWHHHFGKIAAFWAILFIIPFAATMGLSLAIYEFLHVMLLEYLPFIILLLSLYTVAGGVCLKGSLVGTPILNTGILFIGTVLASWMGTTGAAMLLIRPLIRANQWRKNKVHVVIFFIFLVANIGGSLTPLGDPPLFLGFLQGVSFFWTTKAMFMPLVIASIIIIITFYFLDSYYYNKEKENKPESDGEKLSIEGTFNFLLLGGVVASVLLSGFWYPQKYIDVYGVHVQYQNIARDILLLLIAGISWKLTSMSIRKVNGFTWFPIQEVAKLFSGIFITIIPAIAILKAGEDGSLSAVINAVTNEKGEPINMMYFWLTGILSSFLDNAPTYLVFFNTAGGNAEILMTTLSQTLLAISAGAVFLGAMTYIGNAPNFMVKSIAEENQIEMPSFFGYMIWSICFLVPVFILISIIYF